MRKLFLLFAFQISFTISSCTTIGLSNPILRSQLDFGDTKELKLCVLYDPDIPNSWVLNLLENLEQELKLYKIQLKPKLLKEYKRPAFFSTDILETIIQKEKVPLGCDRIMAFFKRNFLDFFLALFTPEIQGAVETSTRTRGFIYADYLSPNIIFGFTPSSTLIHETYHFLGCDHHLIMNECYYKILYSKKHYSGNFFPSFKPNNLKFSKNIKDELHQEILYLSVEEVNNLNYYFRN